MVPQSQVARHSIHRATDTAAAVISLTLWLCALTEEFQVEFDRSTGKFSACQRGRWKEPRLPHELGCAPDEHLPSANDEEQSHSFRLALEIGDPGIRISSKSATHVD